MRDTDSESEILNEMYSNSTPERRREFLEYYLDQAVKLNKRLRILQQVIYDLDSED